MPPSRLARVCLALLCWCAPHALAQCEPDLVSANPNPDLSGSGLCSTLWDPDGSGPAGTRLVVGGSNLVGGAQPISGQVATWDGAQWVVLGIVPVTFPTVNALTVWNGSLIAGANTSVLAWNGSTWQPLGGFGAIVTALTVWNGSLVTAGFDLAANQAALKTWNGSTWTTLPAPPSLGSAKALISYQGLLHVGGTTQNLFSGVIERWNGSTWAVSILTPPNTTTGGVSNASACERALPSAARPRSTQAACSAASAVPPRTRSPRRREGRCGRRWAATPRATAGRCTRATSD